MSQRLIDALRTKYPGLDKKSKGNPLAAIRLFCLECMGGARAEVDTCTSEQCSLYVYRSGKNPYHEKRQLTEEYKQQLAERMRNLNSKVSSENVE